MSESAPKRPKLDESVENTPENREDKKDGSNSTGKNDSDKAGKDNSCTIPEKFSRDLRLTETDVGITEYISQHQGFTAILKQRYSDFIVHEISLTGQIIKLHDFSLPVEKTETALTSDPSCLTTEDQDRLNVLLESQDKKQSVSIKVGDDKTERTKIHQAIRNCFPGLESKTEEEGLLKFIVVSLKDTDSARKPRWPKGRGDYCRFVLYKENKDTMDALNLISKHLRVKTNVFAYAGTKDRRAKSSQEVTAFRVHAESLNALNKSLRNMALGNFSYCEKPLQLGELKGNRFTIILREVAGDDDQIKNALNSLTEVGFINYYGMQRFGTTSVPTHHIGRALLNSEWEKAIELILQPRHEDDSQMAECRKVWWETRNSKKALSLVGKRNCIEQALLQGLVKNSTNFVGALNMIQRSTRTMYVHSYQSFIWNSVVSRRIKTHGLKPLVGDLVLDTTSKFDNSEMVEPIILTETNVKDYGIEDIVLPLPGHDVVFPKNEVVNWYTELLTKDEMNLSQFKHTNRDYSLAGAYRKLVVKPGEVSWSCHQYNDATVPLTVSDLDHIQGNTLQEPPQDGTSKALKIELSLPTSCYATMAVRDILKIDTSSAFQATLNPT